MSLHTIGQFVALPFLVIISVAAWGQTTNAINVTDSRPLAAALDALESKLNIAINYEDPPYENVADLQDVATQKQKAIRPDFRLLVPRIGTVTGNIQVSTDASVAQSDALIDLNVLIADYRQNMLPGDFKVEQANGMIYVTPTKVLGATGNTRAVTSPMMALVTVPNQKWTVIEAMQAILVAVYKATGYRIGIGRFPFSPTDVVTFGATGVPARDALVQLLTATGRTLSYRLLFDPRPDAMRTVDYMMNLQPGGDTIPRAPTNPSPTSNSRGTTSPASPSTSIRPGFPKTKP